MAGIIAVLVAVFVLGAVVGAPVRDTVLPSQASLPDQVADTIVDRFDGKVDRAALDQAGAKAIADAVGDRWTTYFTPEEWASLQRATGGQYTGIGVTIGSTDDALFIREVYAGSPAARAGLKAGESIVAVSGVPVSRRGPVKSRNAMLGKPGTDVVLKVQSPGGGTRSVTVTRGDVTVPMVQARMVTAPNGKKVD